MKKLAKALIPILMIFLLCVACDEADTSATHNATENESAQSDSTKEVDQQSSDTKKDTSTASKKQTTSDKDSDTTKEQPNKQATQKKPTKKQQTTSRKKLDNLEVHYIDVGQADATLFTFGDKAILYDTGDWKRNDTVQYLKAKNITKLDLVIISHPHADHIGQLAEMMQTFDIDEVWMTGHEHTSNVTENALQAVLDSKANYVEPRTGETFKVGDMKLAVTHPKTITNQLNEESLSVLFTYGDIKFMFTGDADQAAESAMLNRHPSLKADILQLGHHGSSTSTSNEFLNQLDPKVAIYSAGKDNSYGHPNEDVIQRVKNHDITLYGTDVNGTIVVSSDGVSYTIKTNKEGTVSPKSTKSSQPKTQPKQQPKKQKETSTAQKDTDTATTNDNCININQATKDDVQQIKHIGPERAEDLIKQRPYSSVDDLTKINGIGPARIEDIKEQGLACAS